MATLIWGRWWLDWFTLGAMILLYLIVRTLYRKQTDLKRKHAEAEDNRFSIYFSTENDIIEKEELELDVDLAYCPSLNHFRIHSRFHLSTADSEYEYSVKPAYVYARLLQLRSNVAGEPEKWMVKDGVVQEAGMREDWAKTKFKWDNVEEKIAILKVQTKWCEIPPMYWNGATYFIMSRRLPQPDSRRYFRQELERLRRGMDLASNELTKLNYKQTENGGIVPFDEPEVVPPEEQWAQFWEAIPKFGITVSEFNNGTKLHTLLTKLLAD